MSPKSQKDSPLKETRTVKPTRRVAALLGFLVKAEADAIFRQQPFETVDGTNSLELWRQFDNNRQQLSPVVAGEMEALPSSLSPVMEEVKKRKTYKESYEAVADYSFMVAPIESLLSPQWYADLDFVDDIVSQLTNLVVGYLLVCHVGEFHVRRIPDALVLGAGGLLMGIQLARWFGRAHGGH